MKQVVGAAAVWVILIGGLLVPTDAQGERHTIDRQNSVITIRVYRSGLFSIFAHNHEITTRITRGEIEDSVNPSVEIWVDADQLRVADPGVSASEQADVQKTMEGPAVLDVRRFPEIHFRSAAVKKTGANRWIVHGDLEFHGKAHPVDVDVAEKDGHYFGSAALKQTDFGISPVSIAGGTVKVKDAVKLEFEVLVVR